MKKNILALFLIVAMLVTACSSGNKNNANNTNNNESTENNNTKKLNIVTSFFPIYDLTKKVAGDKAEVLNLTKNGDAHAFEPNIKHMETIENSDLLIVNGAGMEPWVENIKTNFSNLDILTLSDKIKLMNIHDVEKFNIISEADEDHHDDDHDHDHDHDHGEFDPHIWISPKNAATMLSNIKDKLIELDKENANYYENNYEKYKLELENLSKEYENALNKYNGKSIVVPHVAFNYIFVPHNIKQIGISGINSTDGATATRIAEIVSLLKENNIKTVFYEYGESDKTAQTIANEIGGSIKPISSLEVISQEDIDKGEDYISLMRMNLKNISDSFEGK